MPISFSKVHPVLGSVQASCQKGAALIISLLILLVMTLIGITAVSTTSLEEKMAGNTRDLNLAFQAAESGLRDGDGDVLGLLTPPVAVSNCASNCGNTFFDTTAIPDFLTLTEAQWVAWGRQYGTAIIDITGVAEDPLYILEERGFVEDGLKVGTLVSSAVTGTNLYRATSRGRGASVNTEVIVQSTYAKRF